MSNLVTLGLGDAGTTLPTDGMAGTPADLALRLYLGGYPGTWPWPYLEALRSALTTSACTSTQPLDSGGSVMQLAQNTECYNIVNGLDVGAYQDLSDVAGRRSAIATDKLMTYLYNLVPSAYAELQQLGARIQHVDLLDMYISADSAVARLSGLGSLLTFAATLQLHP